MPARPTVYEFDSFRADTLRRTLERDGKPLAISGKAFDILLVLLERHGEVVDKETLMREVWPDTAVEENNLTVNISGLRKALGETVAQPRLLVTIPGRGYRFAGDLKVTAPPPATDARRIPWLLIAVVLAVCAGLGAAFWRWPTAPKSVAVLPFQVLNPDAGTEYLGLGLADALITRLGNLHDIPVRPLSSLTRVAGKDPLQAGVELGVDLVLEGSVQMVDGQIRLNVRMLSVKNRAPLWSDTFEEPAENALALEDAISAKAAGSLISHLTGEQQGVLAKRSTTNAAAYVNYLRGRYYASRYTDEGFRKALDYLQKAIDIDPAYALAYAGLADTYYDASNMILPPAEAMPRAKAAAQRAAMIDPALAEAHVSLGVVASKYEWNWKDADREFQTALALDPNSASAHLWYGLYLAQVGDTGRAAAELRRAQELDPLSDDANSYLATVLYWDRRYREAERQARKVIEFNKAYTPGIVTLCWILEAQGNLPGALDACRQAHRQDPNAWTTLALARASALAGDGAAATQAIQELRGQTDTFVSGYDVAMVYCALGQKDEAFRALEEAYQQRAEWLGYLKIDPQADTLRSDPRYHELLHRLGL